MPLYMIQTDITHMKVDAIVDPTDAFYSGSGGTDLAIHRAAGPALEEELRTLPPLETGQAAVTAGYALPVKYIIHTFGPVWRGGQAREAELLADCYRSCLRLAAEKGCRSLAFPLISGGTFGFPNDDALQIARAVVSEHLKTHALTVYLVAYLSRTFHLGAALFADALGFVSDHYLELSVPEPPAGAPEPEARYSLDPDLDEMLARRGESFSCMLDRLRHEKGLSGPALYKKAWVHKSVYSKIMNNINYQPAKLTAVAFALALELSWDGLTALLGSAGYAMTRTSRFDTVIEYFVRHGRYDIEQINTVLYELDPDLPLIGC